MTPFDLGVVLGKSGVLRSEGIWMMGLGKTWDVEEPMLMCRIGLYTDESPGLKVDPVVVLVLSLVFIFSVVALHSTFLHCPDPKEHIDDR